MIWRGLNIKAKKIFFVFLFFCIILAPYPASCEKDDKAGETEVKKVRTNEIINNSSLMPKYITDEKVKLITVGDEETGKEAYTPEWAQTLIMMEVHLETATPEGTFQSGVKVLDHCAEMGVNGIWLTPVYEKGSGGNGYGNIGIHTVEPALTGTSDQNEGWKIVKWYVDEAHKRNIRILLDIITWGTVKSSPLFSEHPGWYSGEAWGGNAFDWKNSEFTEWFICRAVENIIKTGADGYRADCEPFTAGYKIFGEIRRRLLEQGRKILIIAEGSSLHNGSFDFEQDGVMPYILKGDPNGDRGSQYSDPQRFYIDHLNIVDSIKTGAGIGSQELQQSFSGGKYRLYTYCVSNHDYHYSLVDGNRLALGYQAIFAPFIPLWYLGEEFNLRTSNSVFYFIPVEWEYMDGVENRQFYEDIKKYIGIRLKYPEIFTYYPDNHRESNICKVAAENQPLQAYARYYGNKAVIIVGNNDKSKLTSFNVKIPFGDMNLESYSEFTLIDLMSGEKIVSGARRDIETFTAEIKFRHIGVYLVEGKEGK
jgi:hypothetical protein